MDASAVQVGSMWAVVAATLLAIALFAGWLMRRRRRLRLRHRAALAALADLREHRQTAAASAGDASPPSPSRPAHRTGAPPEPAPYTGLGRSQAQLFGRLAALFADGRRPLDKETLAACEDILLTSDLGVAETGRVLAALSEAATLAGSSLSAEEVRVLVRAELLRTLEAVAPPPGSPLALGAKRPAVWLFVGVNGAGKTTTIGKLAHALQSGGHQPLLAAGDTYRAAAAEQLGVWAERSQSRLVRGEPGADPASVAYNALEAAKQNSHDIVLLDTAGRLHTHEDLMQQIKKVQRILAKQRADAPDETWLVLDATTGQNALQQARAFHAALRLTGIVLTKLDGSAKGGIVVAIAAAIGVPVRFVGLGEQIEDLQPFHPRSFVEALI